MSPEERPVPAQHPEPPGPRGLPGLGVAHRLLQDPFECLPQLAKQHGDVMRVPVPGMDLIVLSHPDHVAELLNRRHDRYGISPVLQDAVTEPLFPTPSSALDGEPWKRIRRVLNPAFSKQGMEAISENVADTVWSFVEDWDRWADSGEVLDLEHELHVLSMAVLLRAMFTVPVDRTTAERVAEEFAGSFRGAAWRVMFGKAPSWIPRPYGASSHRSSTWVAAYLDRMVEERRHNPIEQEDLLSALLGATFDDGTMLDDAQLRSELRLLITAGHETTATALSWTFALLRLHPEHLRTAYEEVDGLAAGPMTFQDVDRLPWLKACFEEAQRHQGVALTIMAREALEDDVIGGFRIRRGATVGYLGTGMFMDPRFWNSPRDFDPARFVRNEYDRGAFPLFSIGPHRCLGVRLAYLEAAYILGAALQRFEFDLEPGYRPRRRLHFGAARLADGLPVRLRRRSPQQTAGAEAREAG